MECNKDEAMRAKEIAIRKFTEKDYAGAKKFALKAQSLYNGLEGITQMITTFDVFLSAETKINGEVDKYAVLGISPLADDETLKKHFKKLALQLHPDKNKSIGAAGAFQLVSEACNFLSNKANRAAYDSRRNVKTFVPKAPSQTGGAYHPNFATNAGFSVPPYGGFKTERKLPTEAVFLGSKNSSQPKVPNRNAYSEVHIHKPGPGSTSFRKPPKSDSKRSSASIQSFFKNGETFWTMCTRCKIKYEFLRVYVDQILNCPHCQLSFTAVEVSAPSSLTPGRPSKQKIGVFAPSKLTPVRPSKQKIKVSAQSDSAPVRRSKQKIEVSSPSNLAPGRPSKRKKRDSSSGPQKFVPWRPMSETYFNSNDQNVATNGYF
ncbi:unnamed protein product [Amaranthus hypochondriacus]